MYTKTLYTGWADMDFNSHMKNTAYLDKTADVRQMFLIENGFPIEEFLRLRIGPVVMKDEVEYFKEVGLQQQITVTYALAGHAVDGSRFLLRHEIFRPYGKLSARVTSTGGWLSLVGVGYSVLLSAGAVQPQTRSSSNFSCTGRAEARR